MAGYVFNDPNSSTATTTIQLVSPNTVFHEGRNNQTDLRVAKTFTLRERYKIEPTVDFFNIFNAATVLSTNTSLGTQTAAGAVPVSPTFQNVASGGLLGARMVKFGVHFDFWLLALPALSHA